MDPRAITDEQQEFFLDNGYLICPGVIQGDELADLQRATDEMTDYGRAEVRDDPDFFYGKGHKTGEPILRRIEYVIDKADECKRLLGHPFILHSVEKLVGPDLLPTWDSMVLKLPGEGIVVPWHRDAGTAFVGDKPIFNVDFYLDEADSDTCLYVVPGSHKWSEEEAKSWLEAHKDNLTREDFEGAGGIAAPMQPGDVMFHDILVLHGSAANTGTKIRRVLYYEFRTVHVEKELGPHTAEYIPLKQNVLLSCVEKRSVPGEEPFTYALPVERAAPKTYRYPHSDYWRA